jgi:hypothetical protein
VQEAQSGELRVSPDTNIPAWGTRTIMGHSAHRKHSLIPNGRCRLIHELFFLKISFPHSHLLPYTTMHNDSEDLSSLRISYMCLFFCGGSGV